MCFLRTLKEEIYLSIYLYILNPRSEWKRDKKERKKNLVLNEVQEM